MPTLRQLASVAIAKAGWDIPVPTISWSSRMTQCAGLFYVLENSRGGKRPEIRLSTPLIRRLDRPWPIEVCGCYCRNTEAVLARILEHELIHYKLWMDGDSDYGHTTRFRQIAWDTFGHQGIRHGIGVEE